MQIGSSPPRLGAAERDRAVGSARAPQALRRARSRPHAALDPMRPLSSGFNSVSEVVITW
jgi:hypothetical protein